MTVLTSRQPAHRSIDRTEVALAAAAVAAMLITGAHTYLLIAHWADYSLRRTLVAVAVAASLIGGVLMVLGQLAHLVGWRLSAAATPLVAGLAFFAVPVFVYWAGR